MMSSNIIQARIHTCTVLEIVLLRFLSRLLLVKDLNRFITVTELYTKRPA